MDFEKTSELRPVGSPVADEDVQVLVNAGVVADAELPALDFDACLTRMSRYKNKISCCLT